MSEPAQHTKKTISPDLYSRLCTLLQEREAELRQLLDADQLRALHSATGDAEVTDFKDAAAQESIGFVEASKVAHAHAELSRVLTARQRLDEGDYGFCEDCGEPIDERRLLALPATSRCKTCQATHERSHPTSGSGISLG
jgi:RNA polymerase-binding transcription factor DksA